MDSGPGSLSAGDLALLACAFFAIPGPQDGVPPLSWVRWWIVRSAEPKDLKQFILTTAHILDSPVVALQRKVREMRQYELPDSTRQLILDFSKRFSIPSQNNNSKGYGIPSYVRDAMKKFVKHYLVRPSDNITDEQISHIVSLGITQSL